MTNEQKGVILSDALIARLLPEELFTPEELEKRYPSRELVAGAMVTRIAPSPTGPMHVGSLYTALMSERLAHQTGGVFYLRNEDTDKAREVEGAAEFIVGSLELYGIKVDEGMTATGEEKGNYGPYKQSAREKIYKTYIKELLKKGRAYPCFCTTEELDALHKEQEAAGVRPGYYSTWTKWRDRSEEDVAKALDEKKAFVIRFKSLGDFEKKVKVKDILKGEMELSENDQDTVILKSDGMLPTYHMAHAVDDHLMRTTHVIRGDEWLSSVPLHIELFNAFGWEVPEYGHLAPITKMDGTSRRKLSKRKDPEASIAFYGEQGYPAEAVTDYLLNLASSDFEAWRKENPEKPNREFMITLERLARSSGPLFDFVKLNDISKEIVSRLSAEEIYRRGLEWAKKNDEKLAVEMEKDPKYTTTIFNIEREGAEHVRKDIAKWSDIRFEISYFFDSLFVFDHEAAETLLTGAKEEDIRSAIELFFKTYDTNDDRDVWFGKIKALGKEIGYAENAKEYKADKEKFKGQVGDVAKIFRVLLTGRTNTPDLHSIMKVMGRERVEKRLKISL